MKRNRPKEKEPSKGDWRHAIFRRVVSPTKSASPSLKSCPKVQAGPVQTDVLDGPLPKTTRTRDEVRNLWKNAIHQQILLNRMDKQNYLLKAKQEEALGKRVKLSYETIGVCDEEANDTWDLITVKAQKHPGTPCDLQLLDSAILRGIPKHKRGQVWQFFSQQRDIFPDYSNRTKFTPKKDFSYGYLRRQLTSHQHAILIDLGRTFPSHPFFCDPLGTGQLALFNLLKAYSILDPDVGYCQGLSFVAGILLMHYEEEEAFSMLKYFMFDLGAREHYKPEMDGLQIKMYQLTRMIHDQDPELHRFLDEQDILPTLYAAPWFLTMFAAHFSVGFSVRVLDVAFLHGLDMITKFAVLIIVDHRNDLIRCNGLEQIMDCFRHVVTQFGSDDVDRYLKKVLEGDSDKHLLTYAAEYSVMHESFISSMNNESPCPTLKKPENLQVPGRVNCEECLRLQTDLRNLVDFVESSGLDIEHKCPPEVSALVAKYTTRGNNGSKSEFRCDTGTRGDGVSTVPLLIDNRETGCDPNAMLYHSGSSSDELSRESSPSNSTFPVLPSKREGKVGSKNIAQNFLIY